MRIRYMEREYQESVDVFRGILYTALAVVVSVALAIGLYVIIAALSAVA